MSLWFLARSRWNAVTEGFSLTSRCQIAPACSYDVIASAGLPMSLFKMPRL